MTFVFTFPYMKFELFKKKPQAVEKPSWGSAQVEKLADSIAEGNEELIARAETFDELYATIRKIGPIKATTEDVFVPEALIGLIEAYRRGVGDPPPHLHSITRVDGIRDKVKQLTSRETVDY